MSVGSASVAGMANYVLVPGAWLGAWAWDSVASVLRDAGHGVYPVTLSGLAERRDAGASVSQAQHVADIVEVVEGNDLRDVVLAGHSYSGIPVGQAAGLIGDRLRRVVYVDSNVAVDGESFVDGWSDEGRAWVLGVIEETNGFWPPLPTQRARKTLPRAQLMEPEDLALAARPPERAGLVAEEGLGLGEEGVDLFHVVALAPTGAREQRVGHQALLDAAS